MRRMLGLCWGSLVAVLLGSFLIPGAQAVTTSGFATWDPLVGSSNQYTTRVELPAQGFPGADVASDSRSGSVGVQSGASVWLGAATPVGAIYGSSQNQPYLNLRPKADNATSPSRTTYTFDSPTPPTGWAFVLGDIDADEVTISAKDATGGDVSAAQLGFAGVFNLCTTSPKPSGCLPVSVDVPTWNAATRTLTGNPTATDTFGATGWFQPTVSLSSLTFSFTRRAGFPVYQTWFASQARTISGTVSDVSAVGSCPAASTTVVLTGPDGTQLKTTQPAANGTYSFGEYATQPGYVVSIVAPASCAVVGPAQRTVSTASADARADFDVRAIVPQPVSGTVTVTGAGGLAGVTVTLHLPGGGTETTTTDANGHYLFDDNAVGTGYFVSIGVPTGYAGTDTRPPFDVAAAPVTGQDFTLTARPDVSGTVTGGGDGLGGVTVRLTPSGGGTPITTTTDGNGHYVFEKVPAGTYQISIETPPGYTGTPPLAGVVVAGNDVPDQDFALDRPGALGGTVHLDNAGGVGRPGVTVEVAGPGGTQTLTTDDEGNYFLDGLAPGSYQIRIVAPDGFTVDGAASRTVTITALGEIRSGQDFVIAQTPVEPTPTPTPTPEPGGTGTLPNVGLGSNVPLVAGALLLLAGIVLVIAGRTSGRHRHAS